MSLIGPTVNPYKLHIPSLAGVTVEKGVGSRPASHPSIRRKSPTSTSKRRTQKKSTMSNHSNSESNTQNPSGGGSTRSAPEPSPALPLKPTSPGPIPETPSSPTHSPIPNNSPADIPEPQNIPSPNAQNPQKPRKPKKPRRHHHHSKDHKRKQKAKSNTTRLSIEGITRLPDGRLAFTRPRRNPRKLRKEKDCTKRDTTQPQDRRRRRSHKTPRPKSGWDPNRLGYRYDSSSHRSGRGGGGRRRRGKRRGRRGGGGKSKGRSGGLRLGVLREVKRVIAAVGRVFRRGVDGVFGFVGRGRG